MENIVVLFRGAPRTIRVITTYNIISVIFAIIIGFFLANFNQLLLIIAVSATLFTVNYFFLQRRKWSFYLLVAFYGAQMVYFTMPPFNLSFGFGLFIGIDIGINIIAIIMFFTAASTAKYFQIKPTRATLFTIIFIVSVALLSLLFTSQVFIYKVAAGKYVDINNSNEYIELDHYGNITIHESAPFSLGEEISQRRNGILRGKYIIERDGRIFPTIEAEDGLGVYVLGIFLKLEKGKITESKTSRVWMKQN